MAYGCGYGGGYYEDTYCAAVPGCTGGGYGATRYAGSIYGGGTICTHDCSYHDEEIAGHEYAGECVNPAAEFPPIIFPPQTYGCGNGYAGGQFAALMYGGGVPCIGQDIGPSQDVQSNVEEFCILDISCTR